MILKNIFVTKIVKNDIGLGFIKKNEKMKNFVLFLNWK